MDLQRYYPILRESTLFRGMPDKTLDVLLGRLRPRLQRCEKGALLLLAGYENRELGLVLTGRVHAHKTAPDGAAVLVAVLGPGSVFGDMLAAAGAKSPVTLTAQCETLALRLPYARILEPPAADEAHFRLLQNLLTAMGERYFALDRRLELLMCKNLRTRIGRWLLGQAEAAGSDTFTVPLTRAALADHLGCDRSALSRELGRMQREGLLETFRGSFRLLDKARLSAAL